MKKSNPSNQKTLFQSWGKQSTSKPKTISQNTRQNNDIDPIEIVDLGDDDEDDGLLAAAMEMEAIACTTNDSNIDPQTSISSHVSIPRNSESQPKEIEILPGFDIESGNVWIYPTNYPVRDYQFKIVEKALFMNTLVTLPTGLGKTFIAAVLMYNFYRWYPQGKIVFMAPTKPLVAQQIEACYNIMGIPESDTSQMTGMMAPNKREIMWKSKRVFFLTPQVLQNDLGRGTCNAEQIVLMVFDEAHKALGNHAYCQVVREVYGYTTHFRVLALSATPGDDIKAVQQVMTNLLISHMELRSEDSPDIQAYTHDRTVDKIVVPLGEDIIRIKTQFLKVLEGIVARLYCNKALWQKDPQRVTKFMLLSGREQFRKREAEGYTNGKKGAIEGDFAMAISLYHAYELLHQHGILSFYNFIKAIVDGTKGMARAKTEMMRHTEFMDIMDDLRQSIESPPDEMPAETSALFSQFTSPRRRSMMREAFDPSFRSHPKLLKIEEVIVEHFQKFADNATTNTSTGEGNDEKNKPMEVNTRVMIFSQYRDSVGEITAILNKHKPLVRVMSFIGQASTGKSSRGLSQKEQLEVLQRFRKGGYNTLVATCVGEEGLDIGDVDLIVCFDAHASPIRLVQRMGRTGRKRNGRIVVLVSEGKEEQVYKRSLSSKRSIHKAIVQGTKSFELYDDNPRMIPKHLTPRAHKMEMTVGKFVGNTKRKHKSEPSKAKGNISNFLSKSTSSNASTSTRKDDGLLTYEELSYWQENFKLPNCEAGTTPLKKRRSNSSVTEPPVKGLSLNEWMPWQNVPSPVDKIAHSRRTEHLIEILEFIELHSGEDDAYDVEMMSFLNEHDLVGVEDEAEKNNSDAPLIILDEEDDNVIKLGKGNEKKKIGNPKKRKQKVTVENGSEDSKTKSSDKDSTKTTKHNKNKKSKEKKISPQRKWKEYLKAFENEDNDFEPLEKDSSIDDQDDQDDTKTSCQQETTKKDKPIEAQNCESDSPLGNQAASDAISPVKISEEQEHEDPLEISSQSFSQLLPSITPHNAHVLRSKVLGMEKLAKDVPLPPSLDSLNEFSPCTPTKSAGPFEQECKRRGDQSRIEACRRNIQINSKEEESESTTKTELLDEKMKTEKMGIEKNETIDLGNNFSPSRKRSEPDIEEPPDFFEFDNCDNAFLEDNGNEILELKNQESTVKLDKTLSVIQKSRKDSILDEPPTTFEFEEPGDDKVKDIGKENGRIGNKNLGNSLLARREVLDAPDQLNESLDLLESKYMTPKKDSSSVFGSGVVCSSGRKPVDDDIEVAFGDESLTDGFFAEFDVEDLTGDVQSLSTNCNDKNISKDMTNTGDAIEEGSKTEAKDADKSGLSSFSFKASISKLSSFERNEGSPSKSNHPDQSHHSIPNTNKDSSFSKTLSPKTISESTFMHSTDVTRKRDDFEFKKPSVMMVNRCSKSPGSSGLMSQVQRDVTGGSTQTSPLRTSSVNGVSSKLSLKKNTSQRVEKEERSVEKPSSPKQKEKKLTTENENSITSKGISGDLARVEDQHSRNASHLETSPVSTQWNLKPLRERIGFQGVVNISPDSQKLDEKSKDVDEEGDSPIVRKRSKSKNKPMISSLSALTPDPSVTAKDEESPVVRKRSKIKKKNGSVVAIAESDDEDETDVNSTTNPTDFEKSTQPIIAERECRLAKNGRRPGRLPQSDSEEEFIGGRHKPENNKRAETGKRMIQLQTSMKRKRRHSRVPSKKQRTHHINQFLDEEAELSGSDIEDFSDEESDDNGNEFDSFIDDSTQLTQQTPTQTKTKKRKPRQDMDDIYRQSLISPLARNLNFRTPTMCPSKNRYKMKFKPRTTGEGSASEAEETYERESDLENELSFESREEDDSEECDTEPVGDDDGNDDDGGGDEEQESKTKAVGTFEIKDSTPYAASQIRRPLKRLKRKRILNDSIDEDPAHDNNKTTPSHSPQVPSLKSRLTHERGPQNTSTGPSKQPSSSLSTSENHTHANHALSKVPPTRESGQQKITPKCNLNQKSLLSLEVKDRKPKASGSLSTTFEFDWGFDFSDSDLLDVMEAGTGENNASSKISLTKNETARESSKDVTVCDQEMQEIAFAMTATDDSINMEMSEMPTFSLGFDLFGDLEDENDDCNIATSTADPPKRENANSEPKFTKIVSSRGASDRFNRTTQSTDTSKGGTHKYIQNNNLTKNNGTAHGARKDTTNIPSQTNTAHGARKDTTNIPSQTNTAHGARKDTTNIPSQTNTAHGARKDTTNIPSQTNTAHGARKDTTNIPSQTNTAHGARKETTNIPSQTNTAHVARKDTTNIPSQTNRLSLGERSTTSTIANKTNNLTLNKGSCLQSSKDAKMSGSNTVRSGTTRLKDITNHNVTPSCTPKTIPTPSGEPKTIPTAFVSPSQKDKGKLVILADTKEISNSQVVSFLRRKHNIKVEVCQLMHCDYVVSNRMGVVRKLASAVANGANSTKILNKIRILCDLYDRPSFIIEKDRVKSGETERDYSRSNTYIYILACMAQTHIKVLFSESQEETASLLTDLATLEAKKNANIVAPLTMNKETQQVFRFLLTIPRVSFVTALNLCSSLRTLRDLITSSPADLQKTSRQLTESRATDICTYVRHLFDETMVYKDTKKTA